MQALETIPVPASLPEKQRTALISLLADEDPAVYEMVRARLLAFGPVASEWLRPYTLSDDPAMRRRSLEIIRHQARHVADQRFLDYCQCHGEELDLEEATVLLSQTRYPEASVDAYRALYDAWAEDLRGRLEIASEPEMQLGAINKFLFSDQGFGGNDQSAIDPDACYVTRIVDKRRGNPIGLCAIYLFLCRRLRLPVAGIGLPGHFVCRYQSSRKEFYIDCFRKGAFLSKAECVKHLIQSNFGYGESHLTPVSSRRMLLRMCNNLVNTYGHLELTEEAGRVQRYVTVLSK